MNPEIFSRIAGVITIADRAEGRDNNFSLLRKIAATGVLRGYPSEIVALRIGTNEQAKQSEEKRR